MNYKEGIKMEDKIENMTITNAMITKLDFALSFFIGSKNIQSIYNCKNEEEIEELLITKFWENKK